MVEHRKYIVTRLADGVYENNYIDSCRNCQGSGIVFITGEICDAVFECPVCSGSGEVHVTKRIEVKIKPLTKTKNGNCTNDTRREG